MFSKQEVMVIGTRIITHVLGDVIRCDRPTGAVGDDAILVEQQPRDWRPN